MITTKFINPHTMKFQLAPCQIPVVNHTAKEDRYTGTRFPMKSPNFAREALETFSIGLHTEIG